MANRKIEGNTTPLTEVESHVVCLKLHSSFNEAKFLYFFA